MLIQTKLERMRTLAPGMALLVLLIVGLIGVGQTEPGEFFFSTAHASEPATTEAAADTGAETAQTQRDLPAPKMTAQSYPKTGVSSRFAVWLVAQVHLLFGALILAIPIFVLVIEYVGFKTKDQRFDDMAHEFMKISLTAYSITALLGGALAFTLFFLYPDFMHYIMNVFGAQTLVYALLFFLETAFLYIYYYGWNAMRYGNAKWAHLTIGLALNTIGTLLMVTSNSWATFMMAPSGIDDAGVVTGTIWDVMKGPLWNPVNLHRIIANIALGGAVVGAYAAYRYLSTRVEAERRHYDWMGYTSNIIAVIAFLPLPFAGYWLMSEVYAYSQQMGITAMGGILAWLFIVQAMLIGGILLAANYYMWCGMDRTDGAVRYQGMVKYIATGLLLAFLTWITPHTLILSAAEMMGLGGSHHPLLGVLGIMPAKNIAVNFMLILTFLSWQLNRRASLVATVSWEKAGNAFMITVYVIALVNVLLVGFYYGYFTNTVYKVGSSVLQVMSTLSVIIVGVTLDTYMYRGAKKLPVRWGQVSNRSQYALFILPVIFAYTMTLMGFVRSDVRVEWHVYQIVRDNSPDNFVPTIGYASNMMATSTLIFLSLTLFVFWIASLGGQRQKAPGEVKMAPPTGEGATAKEEGATA